MLMLARCIGQGKRRKKIFYRKLDEQYHQLWDYYAMVRKTNVDSYLILMVNRPMLEDSCRFMCIICSNEDWFLTMV